MLWFDEVERKDLSLSADANGNAVLSCVFGSVTLQGIGYDDVAATFAAGSNELKNNLSMCFGDDYSVQYYLMGTAGAFNDYTCRSIFEVKNTGRWA